MTHALGMCQLAGTWVPLGAGFSGGATLEADRPEKIIVSIRPGLHITQTCFRVGGRHFELAALRDLHTRQSAHDPLTRNSAVLGGAGLLGVIVLGPYMQPAGVIAAGAILGGLLVVAIVSARVRPRRLELWAIYHGREVPIFTSEDSRLFGAVDRQLRRSLSEVRHGKVQTPTRPESLIPHPSTMDPSTTRAVF